ncbi:hypothetical protein G4177_14440 [Corallococcus sp. ZKHCc1 1396]|uniref:Uncharacterized protein n=1 Tax=Corallococcus soli TaxID=2710757 RepID=A0ABR9PN69_9BACT|nr:hypothetical protein [Corallococcus soli]MBE4749363.1 hypothetical protein [Corallococcus soli]
MRALLLPWGNVKTRFLALVLVTLAGFSVGVWTDHLTGGVELEPGLVLLSLMFSPVMVPFAGRGLVLEQEQLRLFFVISGLLFWPVYALLASRWMKNGRIWMIWALVGWCALGFFQVVHKFEAAMSV